MRTDSDQPSTPLSAASPLVEAAIAAGQRAADQCSPAGHSAASIAGGPGGMTVDADAVGTGRFIIRLLILLAFLAIVLTADAQRSPAVRPRPSTGEVSFVPAPPMVTPSATPKPTLMSFGDDIADLVSNVRPCVVHIRSFRRNDAGEVTHEETGSGVLMDDLTAGRAVVVTNRHVVAGAGLAGIEVHLEDGRQLRPVEKAEDAATDLAVLRLSEAGLKTARWADSRSVRVGHFALACGSPFGISESFTLGIVSGLGRRALDLNDSGSVINQDFIQTDAAINPGNSGGPLVGVDGTIIGINTAIASRSGGNDGIGFSIPAGLARYITGELLRHGQVRRGFLGVVLDEAFDLSDATRLRLSRVVGAHVTNVKPSTPAARGGLRSDDVVIEFGRNRVEDERHLIHLVSLTPPNEQVRVVVVRGGQRVTLNVTLSERTRTAAVAPADDAPRVSSLPSVRGIGAGSSVY